jgi:hypothetical protein
MKLITRRGFAAVAMLVAAVGVGAQDIRNARSSSAT